MWQFYMSMMLCGGSSLWLNVTLHHGYHRLLFVGMFHPRGGLFFIPLTMLLPVYSVALDGFHLFFWKDHWLNCGILSAIFSRLFCLVFLIL